jgi:LuxR family maltose regulon positive regulatory protein
LLEVQMLLALAHAAAGDTSAALAALRYAVELGEPEGYVEVFADDGPATAPLLRRLSRQEPGSAYLRELLTAALTVPAPKPGRTTAGRAVTLIEPLSERELDVLRLLATDLDGPDIARELHVSLNTMRTHSRNIFRKLQVTSRRAAVRQATALHLLPSQRDA